MAAIPGKTAKMTVRGKTPNTSGTPVVRPLYYFVRHWWWVGLGVMGTPEGSSRSGNELYEIVLAVEELLGGELSGEELAELVNAADPPSEQGPSQ